jgi:hypothetical protein
MKHIKEQNWFAVGLDVIVVIVGIFLGMQVQEWYEERKLSNDEQLIMQRMLNETQLLLSTQTKEMDSLLERTEMLVSANPVLFSQEPIRQLTRRECYFVAGSHSYRRPSDELPILDELLETGRFDILQDETLKANLRSYLLIRERGRGFYQEAINELFRLHSRYPELIVVRRMPITSSEDRNWGGLSGDQFHWVPECNVEKMIGNTQFLNEYVDNVSRINSLTRFMRERIDQLTEIQRILEVKLSE